MNTLRLAILLFATMATAFRAQIHIGWAEAALDAKTFAKLPAIPKDNGNAIQATEFKDPLMLTTLAINGNNQTAVFLSCDLIHVPDNLVQNIIDQAKRSSPKLEQATFVISATNNQTGIDPNNPEIREILAKTAVKTIADSVRNLAPGAIAQGAGYAVLAHNANPRNDKDFQGYESPSDHLARFLFTYQENRLTGVVVNLPCPASCSENSSEISADFWHDVRQAIRDHVGAPIPILTQTAAANDATPIVSHYKKAQDRRLKLKFGKDTRHDLALRKDLAQLVLNAFVETKAWTEKKIEDAPGFACESIAVDDLKLSTVVVGNAAFASNPFKIDTDYMHRIQARSPFENTFVVQQANGYAGPLPTERTFDQTPAASVPKEMGQKIVNATIESLRALRKSIQPQEKKQ